VDTLASLTAAVEARHPHQRGHSARVTLYAEAVARRLGWPPRKLDELRLGCALHDVGKLALPEHVLLRVGALTPEEGAALRRHPTEGARLIAGTESFRRALPYVLYHHERWDGRGYPSGRSGAEIPP
jgi:HD-GYP domain-containing protein (c-di-GMP phosphodiesterase class II)